MKPLPVTLLFILLASFSGVAQQAPTDIPLPERLQEMTAKVSALSTNGSSGLTKAMLGVALERAKASLDAQCQQDAKALLDDVETALAKNPESLVAVGADTNAINGAITAIKTPRVSVGNPYLERLVAGANAELAKPDKPWAKNTPTVNTFSGLSGDAGSRSTGEEMSAWLWLYANPASPMKGNPEVLARFLRLAHAYADALDVHGAGTAIQESVAKIKDSGPKAGQGIFDDFAIAPASCALREFSQLYPNMLLPSQKSQWDRAMANGGRVMWGKAKDRQGDYTNIDIALSFELLNFGLYLKNQEYLDKSKFLAEVQEKNLYPDGGIAYIGHQNESQHYHNADTHYLSRIYEVTGNPKILDLLKKTEWYGPVSSGRLGEFWTAPSWKDTWNGEPANEGEESVAALTGNPYLRGMRDKYLAELSTNTKGGTKGWYQNYAPLPWYRNDVKPLPLPDNYTVLDRNIAGPRAWYRRFTYAASTRVTPVTESGLPTIMGAQLTDPNGHLGQILMGVYPRIREGANELNKDGTFNRAAFAWRVSNLQSTVVMGRSFSAVAGTYQLQQYRSSSPGNLVDWKSDQLWLGLPDRIIGLVAISPIKEGAKAIDIEGILRLGTGGTVNGKPVQIVSTGTNSWSYGDLSITLFAHNYATVQTPEVPFRMPKFPNTEIRLLDGNGSTNSQIVSAYPAATRQWFLVEVRPAESKKADALSLIEQPAGVMAFQFQSGQKKFQTFYNPSVSTLEIPALASGVSTSLHRSDGTVVSPAPPTLTLKPQEVAVAVSSPDSEDHLKGWTDYQEMITQLPKTQSTR